MMKSTPLLALALAQLVPLSSLAATVVPVPVSAPMAGAGAAAIGAGVAGASALPGVSAGLASPLGSIALPAAPMPAAAVVPGSNFPGLRTRTSPGPLPAGIAPARLMDAPQGIRHAGRVVAGVRKKTRGFRKVPKGSRKAKRRLDRLFDDSKPGSVVVPVDRSPAVWPKRPREIESVRIDIARSPADIDRLIPHHENSHILIRRLKVAIKKYGPLTILTYRDAHGKTFVGLDVGKDPRWVDWIPELGSHEKTLIRKIQAVRPDVQVLVREVRKTPDLIVDGVVTELKTDFGDYSIRSLVGKANIQVREFNRRHMISEGDLALDLRRAEAVPVDYVESELNTWASRIRGRIALDRVWVFSRTDNRFFKRDTDDRYHLWAPPKPGDPGGYARRLDPDEVRKVLLLAREGRIEAAWSLLSALEREYGPPEDQQSPLFQAREMLAGQVTLRRIRKLAARPGGLKAAERVWRDFRATASPEALWEIESDVRAVLGAT